MEKKNKFVIINQYNMYYSKTIASSVYHFAGSEKEAHIFNTKSDAKRILEKFKNQENYKIIKL